MTDDTDRPSRMHPADAAAMAGLLGAFSDEATRLERDPIIRGEFFRAERRLRFPMVSSRPGDGGRWIEVRVIDEAEVVEDALRRWEQS